MQSITVLIKNSWPWVFLIAPPFFLFGITDAYVLRSFLIVRGQFLLKYFFIKVVEGFLDVDVLFGTYFKELGAVLFGQLKQRRKKKTGIKTFLHIFIAIKLWLFRLLRMTSTCLPNITMTWAPTSKYNKDE